MEWRNFALANGNILNEIPKKTHMKDFTVRNERPEEYREVENLVRESFWNVYRPGCLEHYDVH